MGLKNLSDDFYELLFRDGEKICLGHTIFEIKTKDWRFGTTNTWEYFSTNPLKGTRSAANVSEFRNMLFEFDKGSRAEQVAMIKTTRIPFSTLVWSGGKSHHLIIALDEDLGSKETFREYWLAVAAVMKKYDVFPDEACKDPSRLSRCPDSIRKDRNEEQTLLVVKKRVTRQELDEYLSMHSVSHKDFAYKVQPALPPLEISADDDAKWKVIKKALNKEFGNFGEGNRHNFRLKAYWLCKSVGFSMQTAVSYVDSEFWMEGDPQAKDCYTNNVPVPEWQIAPDEKTRKERERLEMNQRIGHSLEEIKKMLDL